MASSLICEAHAEPGPAATIAASNEPVHTPWTNSVRTALAERAHEAMTKAHHVVAWTQHGVASWYGRHLNHHRTSSGEAMEATGLTAAHPSLPMGSRVLVTSEDTGRSVIVKINDRGPFNSRIIDLSPRAAASLGMLSAGTAHVKIAPLPEGGTEPEPMEVAEADPQATSEAAIAAADPGKSSHHASRRKVGKHVAIAAHHAKKRS
ncbi:septal ring lytic transglycosylase RlpA family protein [Brytella acorum]|uniref:Endolytic peptidoglycan transglycosylase RlpA n=1 Tax=Brytella acorum TaxID=2959299 RepID=A0AA35VBE5_9PROT|nr:septal ring lytic transglycosylase RlpA family protein [Brytella acorum]MDF3625454.1 septal ring lytic transglycosylase RlpA family protein [Brytella acorum]CAI9120305.1 septal ring lytic transglycosylase RlpA family protein [Brytella acorum]